MCFGPQPCSTLIGANFGSFVGMGRRFYSLGFVISFGSSILLRAKLASLLRFHMLTPVYEFIGFETTFFS